TTKTRKYEADKKGCFFVDAQLSRNVVSGFSRTSMCVAPDQIEQREKKNPDDVDEVPVEAADLDRAVVFVRDRAAPRQPQHHEHDPDADHHVHRVQPGHDEIEREEDLGVTGVRLLELKRRSWYVVLDELVVILDALDAEKRGAEDHRDGEKHHQHL